MRCLQLVPLSFVLISPSPPRCVLRDSQRVRKLFGIIATIFAVDARTSILPARALPLPGSLQLWPSIERTWNILTIPKNRLTPHSKLESCLPQQLDSMLFELFTSKCVLLVRGRNSPHFSPPSPRFVLSEQICRVCFFFLCNLCGIRREATAVFGHPCVWHLQNLLLLQELHILGTTSTSWGRGWGQRLCQPELTWPSAEICAL